MNARLLALRPHSNRSGSISYLRIIALPALASADAIRPSVSPSQSKSSRRNYRSQNAPLTPLASALTQVRIPKHLKPSGINTYAKTGGGWVILLTTFPKRNYTEAPTSLGSIVTLALKDDRSEGSLLLCFFSSAPVPRWGLRFLFSYAGNCLRWLEANPPAWVC
jgi:hypothetical protein